MERINKLIDDSHGGVHCETIRNNFNKIAGEILARLTLAAEIILYGDVKL